MSKTKQLVILSLLMALQVVISMQYIPVGENLRIYFTYLVVVIVAAVFPIKIALAYAAIEDIVAFIAFPSGPFFLGYTLTAVASMLIYSLCLYRHVSNYHCQNDGQYPCECWFKFHLECYVVFKGLYLLSCKEFY